jgi:hypothetical protein
MKTKIIVIASWVLSVLLFCITVIAENEFLNADLTQLISAFLVCVISFFGYKVLPEPVKLFLTKLITFIFTRKKKKDDDEINPC